jgi:gluconate 5-dehydrogenase
VQAVVDQTIAVFGKVDILVNNAGVTWAAEPEAMPLEKWQKVVDINLTGAFCSRRRRGATCSRASGDASSTSRRSPVCTPSVNGPHYAPYAATKAGLMGLTRELAASWGRKGIRVNAIAPASFIASRGRRHRDGGAGDQGDESDSARRRAGRI